MRAGMREGGIGGTYSSEKLMKNEREEEDCREGRVKICRMSGSSVGAEASAAAS
jgi:hypothetical protein